MKESLFLLLSFVHRGQVGEVLLIPAGYKIPDMLTFIS